MSEQKLVHAYIDNLECVYLLRTVCMRMHMRKDRSRTSYVPVWNEGWLMFGQRVKMRTYLCAYVYSLCTRAQRIHVCMYVWCWHVEASRDNRNQYVLCVYGRIFWQGNINFNCKLFPDRIGNNNGNWNSVILQYCSGEKMIIFNVMLILLIICDLPCHNELRVQHILCQYNNTVPFISVSLQIIYDYMHVLIFSVH